VNSFRLRLALVVGTLTAALLLAAGWIAWEQTARFNLERLDQELRQLAKNNLQRVNDASHWERLEVALAFVAGTDRPPPYVLWVMNHGQLEFRSTRWPAAIDPAKLPQPVAYEGGIRFDQPPPPPRRGGLSASNPALPIREFTAQTIEANGSTWRVAATGNPYTTLVLAANLDELNHDLVRLRQRYLAVLPIILVIIGAAAWWLSTRALRPVAALTRAAEGITTQGLDQRIAAPAHDREFQRLVSVFNAMLDRLETGFHQARRFSADASHELKTPLALLQAELEQALRSAPPRSAEQQTYSRLLDEIHHLKAVLEKLLLLALADSGRLTLERTPTRLAQILANVIEDVSALAPEIGVDQVITADAAVSVDSVLLEQALQNLANNALKYNRSGGMVRFVLTAGDGVAKLSVGNTGPGISADDYPRIFERFFRGNPARTRDSAGGVGLGLSLSREIFRAHGGDLVLVTPARDDWTEFVATLPLTGGDQNLANQDATGSQVTQST